MNQRQLEKEWNSLARAEKIFIDRAFPVREAEWQKKIEKYVPDKLESTLNTAFFKAFELIFEKGTVFIEKTYDKEKKQQDYKIDEYAAHLRNNAGSVKVFGRKALGSRAVNAVISAAEGVGMGVFGMGIPDIPIFLSVILKSIYELALTYGFVYDTEEEQLFILKVIEAAMLHGDALLQQNEDVNGWIERNMFFTEDRKEQIRRTSDALSKELLYLKFVQGVPVVGVLGGMSDVIYQKKIADYAALKYKRRFLLKNMCD